MRSPEPRLFNEKDMSLALPSTVKPVSWVLLIAGKQTSLSPHGYIRLEPGKDRHNGQPHVDTSTKEIRPQVRPGFSPPAKPHSELCGDRAVASP